MRTDCTRLFKINKKPVQFYLQCHGNYSGTRMHLKPMTLPSFPRAFAHCEKMTCASYLQALYCHIAHVYGFITRSCWEITSETSVLQWWSRLCLCVNMLMQCSQRGVLLDKKMLRAALPVCCSAVQALHNSNTHTHTCTWTPRLFASVAVLLFVYCQCTLGTMSFSSHIIYAQVWARKFCMHLWAHITCAVNLLCDLIACFYEKHLGAHFMRIILWAHCATWTSQGNFMVKVSVKSKLTLFTFLIYVSVHILSVHVVLKKIVFIIIHPYDKTCTASETT